ncbi:unnamed protein product [Enterobius vermicularis]|uniref:Lipase_3 domain-containing protein n=1 Tax=Enterobius vermicularis TaxID=51028 RepID=A0A0N4VE42_ENTVE|nr:unnamed protein product [Enterobius vermicularis]
MLLWILLILSAAYSCYGGKTQYNETEARMLLNLAAGAYSEMPEICVNKTLAAEEGWILYSELSSVCDIISSLCSGYILRSDALKQIIIVFRGTRTKKQLLTEGWQGIQPGVDFYGIGKVNRYFHGALLTLWPLIEPVVADSNFSSYSITLTGHSLGGALASLAAMKIILDGHRNKDQIKVITFGQPRVGDRDYAFKFDELIPYCFRIVHRIDIVPHLPACKKNKNDIETRRTNSKKCDPTVPGHSYHHGTEIWYPTGMGSNAEYFECVGEPRNEDFICSDSLNFEVEQYKKYVDDHRRYFDHRVPWFGKAGCVEVADAINETESVLGEEIKPELPEDENDSTNRRRFSFKRVVEKVKNVIRNFSFEH